MKREEFLELLEAGLSDCGVDAERQNVLIEYFSANTESLTDDFFSVYTAIDAHKLADSMSQTGEAAADTFLAPKSEEDFPFPVEQIPVNGANPLDTDTSVFRPDQFFYEFASIEDEPEFVAPVIDDVTLGGTRVFDTEDMNNETHLSERKLKRVDKQRRRKNIDRSAKGTPLFWVLFILTLPITVPIFATIWTLFGIMYVVVTALIVGFVGAMVAVVGIGTALTLVGLIFGIIKCFSQLPIGLFEIGFAVAIAGVTMLVSVLIYNLAVRFIPRLYSLIAHFARFVWDSIVGLYYFCKKGV